MRRQAEVGEWLADPSGAIGMVTSVGRSRVNLQYVQNGPTKNWARYMLRTVTQEDIDAAGLSGIGCVPPTPDE